MRKAYHYTRQVNGEPKSEIVILSSKDERDYDEILHRVGLEFCMSAQGRKLYKDIPGLSFNRLMDILTPEMLEPYDVTMYFPQDDAEQMDNAPPVVRQCEMELYRELCDKHHQQLRDIKEYGERIAKRLEALRLSGHPAISTWAPEIIPGKALSWAYQYIIGAECSFKAFLDRKIQEAKPHGATEEAGYVQIGDHFINVNAKARDY